MSIKQQNEKDKLIFIISDFCTLAQHVLKVYIQQAESTLLMQTHEHSVEHSGDETSGW